LLKNCSFNSDDLSPIMSPAAQAVHRTTPDKFF